MDREIRSRTTLDGYNLTLPACFCFGLPVSWVFRYTGNHEQAQKQEMESLL